MNKELKALKERVKELDAIISNCHEHWLYLKQRSCDTERVQSMLGKFYGYDADTQKSIIKKASELLGWHYALLDVESSNASYNEVQYKQKREELMDKINECKLIK